MDSDVDIGRYADLWSEEDREVEIYADLKTLPGSNLLEDKGVYVWRVNVESQTLNSKTYSETVGEDFVRERGVTEDMGSALKGKRDSRDRAEELADLLEERGVNAEICEGSFSEPEYNIS